MNTGSDNTSETGLLSRGLTRLVPNWSDRPDSEHEQAVVRVIIGSAASILLLFIVQSDYNDPSMDTITKIGITLFFILSFFIIAWILNDPGKNVARRLAGCVIDNAGATAALFLNGGLAAPIFVAYLWVSFGNGFRFGRRYLLFSMILSVIGFGSVLLFSTQWSIDSSLSAGLFTGLILLPLYVSTLLRRLENALIKAEIANQAKSNFLATMSHEIRTPLNGLIGLIDLFNMTQLNSKQQHYLHLMKNSSEWLLSVISDGLDFTKIEADEFVIEPSVMDIRRVVNNIAQVFTETARMNGIGFKTDLSDSLPQHVMCDQNRLTQILNNLLNNACKFTDQGQIILQVEVENLEDSNVRLLFTVEDTGIGILRENVEKIFSPFKQIETKNARHLGGTGLGLTIVARLVRLMGGEISVESEPGKGTVFSFFITVPIARKLLARGETLEESISWRKQPLVLLAEDNVVNQEVGTTYLENMGCRVFLAPDGQEAVKLAQEHHFDLVLMDCQMPRMDGYEATRKIRSLEADDFSNIIVALTAHTTVQDRQKCLDAGMDDYMGKPYRAQNLKQLLRKWLDPVIVPPDPEQNTAGSSPVVEASEPDPDSPVNKSLHDFRNAIGGAVGNIELALLQLDNSQKCEMVLKKALASIEKAVSIASTMK